MDRRVSNVPKLAIILMVFMICLAGLMVLHSWTETKDIVSPIQILLGTPQGPAPESIVTRQGNVTVYMPPNATNLEGSIFILPAEDNQLAADDGWTRPIVVNIEFRSPDGTPVHDISFFQPLEVCFSLTEEQWQSLKKDSRGFQVQSYAEEKNPPRWEVLPQTSYATQFQLCGKTYNLSVFGLATKVELPVTGPTVTSTLVPTRTPIGPVPTRERRQRGDPTQAAPLLIPTNPPPTNPPPTQPPPTPTNPPPTEPPPTIAPTEPQPTAPVTEEPTQPPIVELPPLPTITFP